MTSPPNHLRAWREFRKLTQEALANRVGTTGAVISHLELGERQLSAKWLARLAPALGTKPGFLLDHDPEDLDTDILEIWAAIPADRRDLARDLLTRLADSPTPKDKSEAA